MRKNVVRAGSVAVLACVGCQVYTPLTLAPTMTGTPVRVTLTESGSLANSVMLGGTAMRLEGNVSAVTDSTVTLGVTDLTRVSGAEETWKGESVTVRRSDIASVERKQTSVTRSIVLAGAVVAGAYLATKSGSSGEAILNGTGGGQGGKQ